MRSKPLNLLLFFSIVISSQLKAANRYWIATSAANWNSMANWSATSGGTGGVSVPGSSDFVYFNANGNGNCNLNIAPTIGGISISGYTGTIDMGNYNFTINATVDLTFASGKITSSSGTTAILSITTTTQANFTGTNFGTSLTQAPQIQCVAADLFLSGGTYYSTASFEKNGTGLDYAGTGGNTFNGTTTIINSGSAVLSLGYTNPDTFNGDVTFTNSGTSYIGPANKTAGNKFNGNIVVNNPNSGIGIRFDEYTGTSSTLAAGKTITVGTSYPGGSLYLYRFTQQGSTAQNITLTGTATLYLGPSSTFNGNVNFVSPQVYLQGATYNGTAYIEKNGATNNYSGTGGNTFNGTTTLVNSGSGPLITGYANADVFNGDLTLTNTGTANIGLSEGTTGNQFGGNVVVNSSNGNGITIDNNSGSGSTLASGKTLKVGTGFTAGSLLLARFTQSGTTAQTLSLTGSSTLAIGPASTFNASLTYSAPQLTIQTSTFNGTVDMSNTSGNANSGGGNTFNSTSGFTNSGTGIWTLSYYNGDTYNGASTFNQTSTGALRPAFNTTSYFNGNITVNSSTAVKFGAGSGTVQLTGSSVQTLSSPSSVAQIQVLVMNNASGVVLSNPWAIAGSATLTNGVITTTSSSALNFLQGSSVSGASNSSYVDGPMVKTGNSAFTFPVGNGGFYAPISISAPGSTTDKFTAQYINKNPVSAGYNPLSHVSTIDHISGQEYWTLTRSGGTSAVSVTLSWDAARSGPVSNLGQLTVARWDATGSIWQDYGNGGTTGNTSAGTITSQTTPTTLFGPFTLASTSTMNTLPIELLSFTAGRSTNNGASEVQLSWTTASGQNNNYFEIERKGTDSLDFQTIDRVYSKGNTSTGNDYTDRDEHPLQTAALYRLKQIDLDGATTYSKTVAIGDDATGGKTGLTVWPIPTAGSEINLTVTGLNGQKAAVLIVDMSGRSLQRLSTLVSGDSFTIPVNTGMLPNGVYYIKLTGEGKKTIRLQGRFVILR